jgi:hypothetical protein
LWFRKQGKSQPDSPEVTEAQEFKIYRQRELLQVKAALLARRALCVYGEDGCGKSVLASALVQNLRDEGYLVAFCEPATPKQMLIDIAEQFELDTCTLEGKTLQIGALKSLVESFMFQNDAVLVIDDAQLCKLEFRNWLKKCRKRGRCNLLLIATNPPMKDIFIGLPGLELQPMSNKVIREIMISEAWNRGMELSNADVARLLSNTGGNPTLAIRAIETEYLGLEEEGGLHRRYGDLMPLVMFGTVFFVVIKFVGLSISDRGLYIIGGVGGAVSIGMGRLMYSLPKDRRKIK